MSQNIRIAKELVRLAKSLVGATVSVDVSDEENEIAAFCETRGLTWSRQSFGLDTSWRISLNGVSAVISLEVHHSNDDNYTCSYMVNGQDYLESPSIDDALFDAYVELFQDARVLQAKLKEVKARISSRYFTAFTVDCDQSGCNIMLSNPDDDTAVIYIGAMSKEEGGFRWSCSIDTGDDAGGEGFTTFETALDDLANKINAVERKYRLR